MLSGFVLLVNVTIWKMRLWTSSLWNHKIPEWKVTKENRRQLFRYSIAFWNRSLSAWAIRAQEFCPYWLADSLWWAESKSGKKLSSVKVHDTETVLFEDAGDLVWLSTPPKHQGCFQTAPGATSCNQLQRWQHGPSFRSDLLTALNAAAKLSWCNAAIIPQAPEARLNGTSYILQNECGVCSRGHV